MWNLYMIQFITLLGEQGKKEKKAHRSMLSLVPLFRTNPKHLHLKISNEKSIRCNEQNNKCNRPAHGAMTLLLPKETLVFWHLFSSLIGTKSKYLNVPGGKHFSLVRSTFQLNTRDWHQWETEEMHPFRLTLPMESSSHHMEDVALGLSFCPDPCGPSTLEVLFLQRCVVFFVFLSLLLQTAWAQSGLPIRYSFFLWLHAYNNGIQYWLLP